MPAAEHDEKKPAAGSFFMDCEGGSDEDKLNDNANA